MSGPTGARPVGVTIVTALALIAGALGLIASFTIFGLGGGLATFSGLITLAIGLADLGLGYGFWTLQRWSWRLAVALAFINPLWEIARFLFRGADPLNLLVAIAFAAISLYYLNLPGIRSIFGAPARGFPIIGTALDPILGSKR